MVVTNVINVILLYFLLNSTMLIVLKYGVFLWNNGTLPVLINRRNTVFEYLNYCLQARIKDLFASKEQLFDLVSCQFSFHYCFESLPQAECMMRNAAECLRPGGFFIGTIPNANDIVLVNFYSISFFLFSSFWQFMNIRFLKFCELFQKTIEGIQG